MSEGTVSEDWRRPKTVGQLIDAMTHQIEIAHTCDDGDMEITAAKRLQQATSRAVLMYLMVDSRGPYRRDLKLVLQNARDLIDLALTGTDHSGESST